MAAGFWKRLLAGSFEETKQTELEKEEADRLRQEGYVRRHYYFSGRVQEVGFRYTTFYLAENLGLTGWVANLSDGRVEMEVQGKSETVGQLLYRLNDSGRICITHMEEAERPLCREEGFRVRG